MPEKAKLNLVVIYASSIEKSRDFYSELGLCFQLEQHGKGPEHYAASLGAVGVLELYPANEGDTSTVRLGFTIDSMPEKLDCLRVAGAKVVSGIKQTAWGTRAVVEDPDGNRVELVQSE